MQLTIPELSLVLLVGASGTGKSTFAAKHFGPFEALSSDHYRAVVSNDPTNQAATADAFDALAYLAEVRLRRGLLTVIDATNVSPQARARWVTLAKRYHVIPVAIVLDLPTKLAIERNKGREDRNFGGGVVRKQASTLHRSMRRLRKEGFRYVHLLKSAEQVEAVEIERPRPWTDRSDEGGPFDLIGDIHGCHAELLQLIDELGHTLTHTDGTWSSTHPEGRRLLFLGDLVDRGPASDHVLELVMDLVEHGDAICVPGNHEAKLLKWLRGKNVRMAHGIDLTIEQLQTRTEAFRARAASFIDGLVSHFVLDDGRLVVAHAGMKESLAGRASGRVRAFALYGETTGETDEFGLPVRYPWAEEYRGRAAVVYGHTPVPEARWLNNTLCIDTGCVFGGELTALRWPEREMVSVPAAEVYCEPVRPLKPEVRTALQTEADGLLHLEDVLGDQRVQTRIAGAIRIPADRAPAALEVLSRFAVDPRWLIHLPPTMSPTETSRLPDLLEHPAEAFASYRKRGVRHVVIEAKHMGSRSNLIVGRTAEALAERFGFESLKTPGIVLSRRGRRFFRDPAVEAAVIRRVRAAVEAAGLWHTLNTDWLLLDAELMPWSAKARQLLVSQYAPVGAASRHVLSVTQEILDRAAERQEGVEELQERTKRRAMNAEAYTAAYRRYCWQVSGVDDLRLAPFHLLASEGQVHADKPHAWHMNTLAKLAAHDELLVATEWRAVDLDDAQQVDDAISWWTAYTATGAEGMVIKPADFHTTHKGRPVQPALKCRGREYLRIIYGPEYTEHLDKLRKRSVGKKGSLALREFALGLESLHRFVDRAPLREVHACVFAILALEAEPVDPRL